MVKAKTVAIQTVSYKKACSQRRNIQGDDDSEGAYYKESEIAHHQEE